MSHTADAETDDAATPSDDGEPRGPDQSPFEGTLAFVAARTDAAEEAARRLIARYGESDPTEADIIVALGGDGFMLQTLHEHMDSPTCIYGMNRGTVGFLMNDYEEDGLRERIGMAEAETIRPLRMTAINGNGDEVHANALNEVSLIRQSYQAAKIRISVDDTVRLQELIADGVMIATPAGSTAYNLSAHGPILPMSASLLALTPVSPFRPRRWRGALLPNQSVVRFDIQEPDKRPVNAVADHTEVKSVRQVVVRESRSVSATILFDKSHGLDERILAEQFRY